MSRGSQLVKAFRYHLQRYSSLPAYRPDTDLLTA